MVPEIQLPEIFSTWTYRIVATSILLSLGGFWVIRSMILRLAPDHFVRPTPRLADRNPVLGVTLLVLRNVIGGFLIVAGLIMIITPGPGLISLVIGVSLADVPAKRQALLWLLKKKSVRRSLNWIRRSADCQPLKYPKRSAE